MPFSSDASSHHRGARLVAAPLLFLSIVAGVAQPGSSNAADGLVAPASVETSTCHAEPRSFEDVRRLATAPTGTFPSADADPAGEPASAAVTTSLRALVAEFLRCSADGEPLRVWGLYSDAYLARLLSRERGYDRARYEADTEPRPLPPGQEPVLRSFMDVTAHASDRAAAHVAISYPNLGREKAFVFRFARGDGTWRIDEIQGEITFSVP